MDKPIYSAAKRALKVRLVLYLSCVCVGLAAYAGYFLFLNFGTNPADDTDGELAPIAQRLAWSLTVVALGGAFYAGMLTYVATYAVEIAASSDRSYRVSLLTFLGSRHITFKETDIARVRYHHGQLNAGGVSVNAPWTTLWLTGRRLPILIDAQGERLDVGEVERLVRPRRSEPPNAE